METVIFREVETLSDGKRRGVASLNGEEKYFQCKVCGCSHVGLGEFKREVEREMAVSFGKHRDDLEFDWNGQDKYLLLSYE